MQKKCEYDTEVSMRVVYALCEIFGDAVDEAGLVGCDACVVDRVVFRRFERSLFYS